MSPPRATGGSSTIVRLGLLLLLPHLVAGLARQPVTAPSLAAGAQKESFSEGLLLRHPWPLKNGNLMRTGQGAEGLAAPRNLSTAAWVLEAPEGEFYSSPVIDHDQNVIFSNQGKLYSLSREGKLNWEVVLPQEERTAGQMPTPVLYGDVLYTTDGQGYALCIELATGQIRWRRSYAHSSGSDSWAVGMDPASQSIFVTGNPDASGSSRCMWGGTHVYSLDAADGSVRWSYPLKGCSCNIMPAVVDGTVYFSGEEGQAFALRAASGEERWYRPGVPGTFTTAAAVVGDGVIYAPSNLDIPIDANGHRGMLSALRMTDGELLWKQTFDREANAGAAIFHDRAGRRLVTLGIGNNAGMPPLPLLGDDAAALVGSIYAFDAETGEQVWEFTTPTWTHKACAGSTFTHLCLPDTFTNPSIDGNGVIYMGWQGGTVFAINGTSGEEVSQYGIESGMQGAPGIASGMLVAASCRRVAGFLESP